jgi:hypothetical protein
MMMTTMMSVNELMNDPRSIHILVRPPPTDLLIFNFQILEERYGYNGQHARIVGARCDMPASRRPAKKQRLTRQKLLVAHAFLENRFHGMMASIY